MSRLKSALSIVLVSVFAILTVPGCGDSADPSPDWTASKVAKYVEDNSGFTSVELTKNAEKESVFSGTAVFDETEMECSVTVESNQISWKAKSESVEETGVDGSRSVTGGSYIEGSKAW